MICWRVAALDPAVGDRERGGMLWFPRIFQGEGRHDNPDLYGCLYVAAEPVGAVHDQDDPLTRKGTHQGMLSREKRHIRTRKLHGLVGLDRHLDIARDGALDPLQRLVDQRERILEHARRLEQLVRRALERRASGGPAGSAFLQCLSR